MNHLQGERSLYLRQHAGNPVDWRPWGDEAFELALREGKPIFLSIGYSACHWCHVMEHESFEDQEVAELLNKSFVSIKVDREERPEIDSLYMGFCQALSGSGGWPMSIFMTPDAKPFFAATYIPKNGYMGSGGLMDLLPKIAEAWRTRRVELSAWAAETSASMSRGNAPRSAGREDAFSLLEQAYAELSASFDPIEGGIGLAPKFPQPHRLIFLKRYAAFAKTQEPLRHLKLTLDKILSGGICDQLGGGFHRYATNRKWSVPHFEKMLYDQALLGYLLAEMALSSGGEKYAEALKDLISYAMRDMRSPEGAFYAAEDADSEGEEGRFYAWSKGELQELLTPDELRLAFDLFELTPIEAASAVLAPGKLTACALSLKSLELDDEKASKLKTLKSKMLEARGARTRPIKDTKILCSWNGLMLGALAKASVALDERKILDGAKQTAGFLLAKLWSPERGLRHAVMDGEACGEGVLDDYAFMAWGLIELYASSFDMEYLKAAMDINAFQNRHFSDGGKPPFHLTSDFSKSRLPFRPMESADNALPCGQAAAILNNARLALISGDEGLMQAADAAMRSLEESLSGQPSASVFSLIAMMAFLEGVSITVAEGSDGKAAEILDALKKAPDNLKILFKPKGKAGAELEAFAPAAKGKEPVGGKTAIFICKPGCCLQPAFSAEEALRLLKT